MFIERGSFCLERQLALTPSTGVAPLAFVVLENAIVLLLAPTPANASINLYTLCNGEYKLSETYF
jgi:hypothetical protein